MTNTIDITNQDVLDSMLMNGKTDSLVNEHISQNYSKFSKDLQIKKKEPVIRRISENYIKDVISKAKLRSLVTDQNTCNKKKSSKLELYFENKENSRLIGNSNTANSRSKSSINVHPINQNYKI